MGAGSIGYETFCSAGPIESRAENWVKAWPASGGKPGACSYKQKGERLSISLKNAR